MDEYEYELDKRGRKRPPVNWFKRWSKRIGEHSKQDLIYRIAALGWEVNRLNKAISIAIKGLDEIANGTNEEKTAWELANETLGEIHLNLVDLPDRVRFYYSNKENEQN